MILPMSGACVLAPASVVAAVLARATPLAFTLAFVWALALVLIEICDCALMTPGATLKPRFASAFVLELCSVLALASPPALTPAFVFV